MYTLFLKCWQLILKLYKLFKNQETVYPELMCVEKIMVNIQDS